MSYKNRGAGFVFSGVLKGVIGLTDNVLGGGYFTGSYGVFIEDISNLVRFENHFDSNDHGGMGNRIPMHLSLTWLLSGAFLTGAVDDTTVVYPIDAPSGPVTTDLTGTYTVTVNSTEFVDLTYGTAVTDPNLCDTFPYDRGMTTILRVKTGQSITATCIYGGATVSKTCTAAVDFDLLISTKSDIFVDANRVADAYMEVDATLGGLVETTGGGSISDSGHSAQWGSTVRATAKLSGNTSVQYVLAGLYQYDWQVRVNAFDIPYPDTLHATVVVGYDPSTLTTLTQDVTITGGNGSLFIEQKSYLLNVGFDGTNVKSEVLNNICPVSARLTSASLAALGEDTDLALRNLWMRGYIWNAMTLDQSFTLDAISGSWTDSGGAIHIPATSFDGRLKGSSWDGVSFAGYPKAKFYLTSDAAGRHARINLGAKYWNVTVGTTGFATIDLNFPDSTHSNVDTTNSEYPWTAGTTHDAQNGWSFGVRNFTECVIDHLDSGHPYTITKITLFSDVNAQMTFLDSFKNWVNVIIGDDTTSYRAARIGDTGGQQSYDVTDWVWTHIPAGGGFSDTISPVPISSVVSATNGSGGAYPTDGYYATDLQTNDGTMNVHSGLLNSDEASCELYGSGLLYDGTTWHTGCNVPASGTVQGQFLFNSFQGFPGAGDVFEWAGGGFGTPIKLRAAIILRGQAWGLTFNDDGTRSSGVNVTINDSTSHVSYGTGISDSHGEFKTGTPYIKGLKSTDVAAGTISVPGILWETRQKHRFAFVHSVAGVGISYDCSEAGRHVLAYGDDSGKLQVGFAPNLLPVSFTFTNSGVTGLNPCIKFEKLSNSSTVWLAYEISGSGVYAIVSSDEGTTWSSPMTINPIGTHVAETLTRQGTKHFFFYESGTIKSVVWDGSNNVIIPEFTAVGSGVDDDQISAGEFVGAQGEHRIGLAYRSGGMPTFKSASDAKTFV